MSDKMLEVPPITDETYKALMVALGMPNNRSLLSALQQIANHATQRAAWQAEQSVPVVGEVVGYLAGGTMMHRQIQGYECKPLVVQPTSSITTAELERLRKDAERYQAVVIISQAALRIPSARTDETNRMLSAYQKAVNASLGIEQAIDAAIAAEGEQE